MDFQKDFKKPLHGINMNSRYDIVIIGSGLIGSSIAYHLSQKRGSGSILVLDIDMKGTYSSSELNAGGARMEWCHDVNIELSKATIDFLASHPDQFGFRQKGYLWLYNQKGWNIYQEHAAQFKCHSFVEELSPKEVQERFPFIDRIDDIEAATFSPRDGIFNPNLLKQFYRSKAKEKGVQFKDGAHVKEIIKKEKGLDIIYNDLEKPKEEDVFKILTEKAVSKDFPLVKVQCDTLINSTGPWAQKVAKLYGHEIDCKPVRRQISIFDCKDLDLSPYGMIVDTSGVYFHAEADHILAGYATPHEPSGYNFTYDADRFFEQEIWPRLLHRMSKAEALKHITGWAGLYSVTPDLSGIMGLIDPKYHIYEAHSFTGRGAMQSHGVGLAMAELILDGKYSTIDASSLHPDRFHLDKHSKNKQKLLYEGLHI